MKKICLLVSLLLLVFQVGKAQNITIQVNANEGRMTVSPYIYGRNNNFSDSPAKPTTEANINLYKEAGLRFARENGGNNATKYNWRRKLSSHPDWYNNVYDHSWDFASQDVQDCMPGLQVMWAFQLIGKAAGNKNNNFNDWSYNQSQWWSGVGQNLAGGGQVNPAGGSQALVNGNPDLYLVNWTADSTTGVLNHWFGTGGLGLDKNQFLYWSMDNEPEIWNGTHDDVMPSLLSASAFMDSYFAVAKKARERFPEIKLTGPVPANEWQWYKWGSESLTIDGKYYCWLEYFIKRVADEQKATGIRLLDVLDVHWYPSESSNADLVQLHRVFYDETYVYPGANGVKTVNGGWDGAQTKEYIFKRINGWLNTHFGENHGITIALTENDISSSNPNIVSVVYASMLGTFADNGVEIFTPWSWKTGMWETLHLFSRYAKTTRVRTTSSGEATVSGYSTVNGSNDSMTVILVNRDLSASRTVTVNLTGFSVSNGNYSILELSSLPSTETFISHTSNALKSKTVAVSGNSFTLTLPALSTTAVILAGTGTGIEEDQPEPNGTKLLRAYPNPTWGKFRIPLDDQVPGNLTLRFTDLAGNTVLTMETENNSEIDLSQTVLPGGLYVVTAENGGRCLSTKLFYKR
ncbi:MAG: T9SS type A sorting domain-containing protein [Bacteroidales bacterium]|nr:T9SS type A sorting domain-containing protein [Bacteroidales bacterium]